jgi:hypothetical protein
MLTPDILQESDEKAQTRQHILGAWVDELCKAVRNEDYVAQASIANRLSTEGILHEGLVAAANIIVALTDES